MGETHKTERENGYRRVATMIPLYTLKKTGTTNSGVKLLTIPAAITEYQRLGSL